MVNYYVMMNNIEDVIKQDSRWLLHFLKERHIKKQFFDKIYTDDGKTPPKPEPYCAGEFLKAYGIKPENAVMVGDTLTDAKFAENAGMKFIAVASDAAGKELEDRAAAVIHDVSGLDLIIEGRA